LEPDKFEEASRLFYLGLDCQSHGRLAEAESLYLQSLSLAPDRPSILTNLCVVLIQQDKQEAAIQYIDRALELNPEDEAAWIHKAIWLFGRKRPQEALTCCDKAITINHGNAEAHYNRGLILANRGLGLEKHEIHEDALASIDRALAINPKYAAALHCRGNLLQQLGRDEEAIISYRAALANGYDPEELRFSLAALGADATPAAAPADLVVRLFDMYAAVFDQHLTALQYRSPQTLFDAVSPGAPAAGWDIADLGCGTGLCGPLFRPIARTLSGVDLSLNMIRKAKERNVYDQLIQGDITEFLRARAASFDLVIAADVLIYVGDLAPVFDAARQALRRGGRFAFSVETHEGTGFVLQPWRRFAHSLSYVRECAAHYGLGEVIMTREILRKQGGKDVQGGIAVLRLREN